MTCVATPVRERPILFSGEMVRAILDGRKTQTRRVVNHRMYIHSEREGTTEQSSPRFGEMVMKYVRCPFGQVGDRLWVRETFQIESNYHADARDAKPPFNDGRPVFVNDDEDYPYWEQCHYAATDRCPELLDVDTDSLVCRWRPSIHMPRWASRITLEVTGVRVERVQEIAKSRADLVAEGIQPLPRVGALGVQYMQLWDDLNKSRGFGWDANPWVWVIEFKKIAGNEELAA